MRQEQEEVNKKTDFIIESLNSEQSGYSSF